MLFRASPGLNSQWNCREHVELWLFVLQVLLEGTLLLMDTSGILDTVLGAMSMAFILDVDEMLPPACPKPDSFFCTRGPEAWNNATGRGLPSDTQGMIP